MAESDERDIWSRFYRANVGRAPRPLFVEALALAAPQPTGAPRQAVDLGCGDGTETLALLQHGWQVLLEAACVLGSSWNAAGQAPGRQPPHPRWERVRERPL